MACTGARARVAASLAAALVLASCTSHGQSPPPGDLADRFHTATPIKHLVFIIKENRSFDDLFGMFPGADGTTVADDNGTMRPLQHSPSLMQRLAHDLPHDRPAALADWDHGKMDGFGFNAIGEKYAFTQLTPNELPNYWHWAKEFVLADHFFSSVGGPSFPNHLFSIAAQSDGVVDNPSSPPRNHRGNYKTWGCDSPRSETVEVIDTEGKLVKLPPCFDFRTVGDELTKKGIPWNYYAADPTPWPNAPGSGYIWNAYAAIRHYREDPSRWRQHVVRVQRFTQDVADGRMAPVTWITPQFALSEHPEYNFCHGENWTTQVVDSVMRSPFWKNTAIVITWDEWGGFYDHVPPPQVDRYGLGIRVPFLMISPYSKHGYVDHHHAEFSDVVRFIEDNWGTTHLATSRDRRAGDLYWEFDFHQKPRPPDPLPLRTGCLGPAFSPAPPTAYK